jgi:hypothetical protein
VELLDLGDGLSRVKTLGTDSSTVEDRLAAIKLPVVVEELKTLLSLGVTRISNPAVSLKEDSRTEILVTVPPV